MPSREVYNAQGLFPGEEHKMRTFTGRHVDPLHLQPEDVVVDDIAHALARQCRFNGQCVGYISVAYHCACVHDLLDGEAAAQGLMHDAAEAYLGDIIRPIKYSGQFGLYLEAEERAERAIAVRFNLPWPWPDVVKAADNATLHAELTLGWDREATPKDDEALFMSRYFEHWS